MFPLVSCMMLTYNRFKPFMKSYECFMNQTYPNTELIIINSGDKDYHEKVTQFLRDHAHPDFEKYPDSGIKYIWTEKATLGELRNKAIDASNGDYVIVFDDDDIHHSERIERQMELCLTSRNIDGTILRNFTAVQKRRIFKDKKHTCTMLPGLEGTLVFRKGDVRYPEMNQGEDTSFLEALKEDGYNIVIIDEPYNMYEYNFYGNNTVSKKHFVDMIERNQPLRFE